MSCVIQEKTFKKGVYLKHRKTNFTLVEGTFVWKQRTYISDVTQKRFFLHIYIYINIYIYIHT